MVFSFDTSKVLIVISGRIIGFAAVVAIADIIDRYPVTVNMGIGEHRNIRLPFSIIGGLHGEIS